MSDYVVDMLCEAATILRRENDDPKAEALAEVLLHEAGWAQEDPEYRQWQEAMPVAAARIVLARRRKAASTSSVLDGSRTQSSLVKCPAGGSA